jgi:hypothetical protein
VTTPRDMEMRSSAITLSDMEIFVFPELIYALLLANIMSPRLWKWLDDPWFDGLAAMKPYRRITRLKQYIMDHYAFNLDLDTWGLTTKDREMARFGSFLDAAVIKESNALFGYEGDRYYFDIDIRTHFGLDKYTSDTIPYWKTETVEAMDAFRYRKGYSTGAGECVSLATLYAAGLFIVAGIPLDKIYLLATPLHSQNFVDVDDGILTNNRRLVTKKMWCNGTALSAQARRALENERVTLVAHETGYVHAVYADATLSPAVYERFSAKLRGFLNMPLTDEVLGNFLRHKRDLQKCFQIRHGIHGAERYVSADVAFQYEEGSSYLVTDKTRENLLAEIDMDQFMPQRMPGRIVLNDLEAYIRAEKPDLKREADVVRLKEQFACECINTEWAMENLIRFCHVEPKLPEAAQKQFHGKGEPLGLTREMGREGIIRRLEEIRGRNMMAEMAFYAYRDLSRVESGPFIKAALERCPVSVEGSKALSTEEVDALIRAMPEESIYDEAGRLAQPDEVWNYGRGDGVEKVLLLANILRHREPGVKLRVEIEGGKVRLLGWRKRVEYSTTKGLAVQGWELSGG